MRVIKWSTSAGQVVRHKWQNESAQRPDGRVVYIWTDLSKRYFEQACISISIRLYLERKGHLLGLLLAL